MLPEDTEGDRLGNGWAQIEYSAHGTGRWTHPDLFFSTEYTTADGTVVKTIVIDTPTLTGVYAGGPPLPDRDDPRSILTFEPREVPDDFLGIFS